MSNSEIITRFENGKVSCDAFHHADHVRLAFAYLRKHPQLTALARFVRSLKKFAASNGKDELYHETITYAYLFLINERMAAGGELEWEQFAERNPDLLEPKNGILGRYYRESTLNSVLGRRIFLLPDKSLVL